MEQIKLQTSLIRSFPFRHSSLLTSLALMPVQNSRKHLQDSIIIPIPECYYSHLLGLQTVPKIMKQQFQILPYPPRFHHLMDKQLLSFHHTSHLLGLTNNSVDWEMTIPNPSIPSSFSQVFSPPNGQTTHSIPLHFPPTISDTSSESNQTLNGQTNLSNLLLFPAYYKSETETETDDSTSSESNVTFCTITSRQIVVQGSHFQQLLPQQLSNEQGSMPRCTAIVICDKHK